MDVSLLQKVALFQGLTPAQLQKIAAICQPIRLTANSHVFKEGDAGATMYIIVEGRVRISKMVGGMGEEALAILEPGSYFGEMSVIEDSPRSADAIAHTACTLWAIERDAFDQLMFTDKELAYVMLWTFVRTLSERLRETNEKVKAFFAISRF
jgi:CRP/FNR family transcriptional regulator, cyclic AMP receptor protein